MINTNIQNLQLKKMININLNKAIVILVRIFKYFIISIDR